MRIWLEDTLKVLHMAAHSYLNVLEVWGVGRVFNWGVILKGIWN